MATSYDSSLGRDGSRHEGDYLTRRDAIATYFDKTAVKAWERLTSDKPVSGIRATVREGRGQMRSLLLSWLPDDLHDVNVLDAGCGTGALAVEAARRGATVTAIDISPNLVDIANRRTPPELAHRITWLSGDFGATLGNDEQAYDYVVAMDSLIHYPMDDITNVLSHFTQIASKDVVFTFAPRTVALTIMHATGRIFPRADRAPSIIPVAASALERKLSHDARFNDFSIADTTRVDTAFYKSQAMKLAREQ